MQTYHDRKTHLAITVDRTYQTGHTAASLKQLSITLQSFKGFRIPGAVGMMHVLYSSKESTRNGEKGILTSLRDDLLLSLT